MFIVSNQTYASTAVGEHYDDLYIRKWLNNDFLKGPFSVAEQETIVETPALTRLFLGGTTKFNCNNNIWVITNG